MSENKFNSVDDIVRVFNKLMNEAPKGPETPKYKPAPGEAGSSEDNPISVGMTGENVTRMTVEQDGVWYETDGLGNGTIR